jgi:hypothetical protein
MRFWKNANRNFATSNARNRRAPDGRNFVVGKALKLG